MKNLSVKWLPNRNYHMSMDYLEEMVGSAPDY